MKKRYVAASGILVLSVCAVFAVTQLVFTLTTTYRINDSVQIDMYYDDVQAKPDTSFALPTVDPGTNSTFDVAVHNIGNCAVIMSIVTHIPWPVYTDMNNSRIEVGQWENSTITVCPPSNATAGEYPYVWTITFNAV
jgi:hypothetical protein